MKVGSLVFDNFTAKGRYMNAFERRAMVWRHSAAAMVVALAVGTLASCGGNPIVGKWSMNTVKQDDSTSYVTKKTDDAKPESYTFMADGTVERYYEEDDDGEKTRYVYQGNWKYEEPVVTISLVKRGKMNAADAVSDYDDLNSEMVRYGVYNGQDKTLGVARYIAEKDGDSQGTETEEGTWEWTSKLYYNTWLGNTSEDVYNVIKLLKAAIGSDDGFDGNVSCRYNEKIYSGHYKMKPYKTSSGEVTSIDFTLYHNRDETPSVVGCDIVGSKMYVRTGLFTKAK